jgi:zinc protease
VRASLQLLGAALALSLLVPGCPGRPPRPPRILPPPPPPAARLELPRVERFTLPGGLRVLLLSDDRLPLTRVHLMLRTGSVDDPPDRAGLAELTLKMLRRGSRSRSADQIAELADGAGISLGSRTDYELSHLSCGGRSQHTGLCLELIAEAVTAPTLPAAELEQQRQELIAEARQSRGAGATLAELHFDHLLFGEGHPLGRAPSEASLRRIEHKDLRAFFAARVAPGAAVLAVSGDVGDLAALRRRIEALLGSWRGTAAPRRVVRPVSHPPPGLKLLLVDKPGLSQSFFALGHAGIRRTDPRRDAARVLNRVLSGIRLYNVVRARGGKTYSIRSRFDIATDDGSFIVKSFTRHAQLVDTLRLIRRELSGIRRRPPSPEELSQAKGRLIGGYPLSFSTPSKLAAALLQIELLGLPPSYITDLPLRVERLSSSQIAAAVRALIRPDRLVAVVVAPAAEVAPRLRAAGLRFEQVSYLDPIERPRALTHAVTISADQQARARQLLGQALAAAGGARLREVKEVRVVGRVHIVPQVDFASPPLQGSYRLTLRPPDRLDLTMHLEAKGTALKMSSRQQLLGQGGFIESDGKRRPLSAGRVLRLRQALWRQPILVLRQALAPGVRSRPAPAAAGKLAVELFAPKIPAMTLTLDGASKRLLGLSYRDDKGEQRVTTLSDHRKVDGVLVPFTVVNRRGTRVQTLTLEKVELAR